MSLERLARGLTVISFLLLCWVAHRALQFREDCVNSALIAYVSLEGRVVPNCRFESRLSLRSFFRPLNYQDMQTLRQLESVEEVAPWLQSQTFKPELAIHLGDSPPESGWINLDKSTLTSPKELKRQVILALVQSKINDPYGAEVFADLVLRGLGERDHDVKFSTTPANVRGLQPLIAEAIHRLVNAVPLTERWDLEANLRNPTLWPAVVPPADNTAATLSTWFQSTLATYLRSAGWNEERHQQKVKRVMKELEVDSPVRWELTVDLTRTPAWREIYQQLKTQSRFAKDERWLVFTPEGERALPSDLPVTWDERDIFSQKHVMIACDWPGQNEAIKVKARRMFAQQSCERLDKIFWN